MLRNTSLTDGSLLITLIALAGCGSSGQSSVEPDAAMVPGVCGATDALTGPTPQTPPTLETGVDREGLVAAIRPQILAIGTQPSDFPEKLQLGRPWGEFEVHKGPRLVFRGRWYVPYGTGGDYTTVAEVVRDGDSYKEISVGFAPLATLIGEREQIPAVSAALDRGRAGFLQPVCAGDVRYLAYEAESIADAGQAEIRVQNMPGVADMSLDELNASLPAE